MKDYLKGAIIGFSFIFLCLAGVYWADKEGYFLLKHLEFQAVAAKDFAASPVYADLQKYFEKRLNTYKDKSLLSINMKSMTTELNNNEWVSSIYVRRSFPNRLKIDIQPKEWVAYLREEQVFYPVTSSGEILSKIDILDGPDLPIVSISKEDWASGLNKVALDLIAALPEAGYINKKSTQEIKSDKEGFYIMVSPTNTMIRLGHDEILLRLARSEKVLEYLHQRNLQGRVINSSFAQKVVVKLRKAR